MIVAAALIYLLSHLLRSVRFYFLYGDNKQPFRETFLLFQSTASAGYFIPVWLTELLRLVGLAKVGYEKVKLVLTYFLVRTFDVLLLSIGSIFVLRLSRDNLVTIETDQILWLLAMVSTSIVGFLVIIRLMGQSIYEFWFIKTKGPISIAGIRNYEILFQFCVDLFDRGARRMVFAGGLTIIIWMFDLIAVSIVVDHAALNNVTTSWITFAVQALVGSKGQFTTADFVILRENLFFPQVLVTLVLLIWWSLAWRKKRSS